MFSLEFTEEAKEDLTRLKKTELNAYKKAQKLLLEIIEHPTIGTGQVELLKHGLSGLYSRRISQKHRLIYKVFDDTKMVLILAASSHYGKK
ncbi:Txe/YoeB family addiction module toxin [Pedobacter mucosus]|uniref:Txe/YoeB family addiction module toxin n=1 Tax=Pedobacter mucosus TaxID=2895286 RepID=UPI001EE4A1D6|nr:Txe/YoeB family addiction module toxin [Pedobacter mucosus]UKT65490.1 Txe/YoeB family addiction module toxin [Pedobacter mucosus]